jgi:thiamine-monophosphate kinase
VPGRPSLPREDALIERIRRRLPSSAGGVLRTGIGDDAAVLRPSPVNEWVITCDQFIEGVHFLDRMHPPDAVGYKALARATSDIAAMGARPRLFFLSIALPSRRTGLWLDKMLGGMARAAGEFGLILAGGDTARPGPRADAVALTVTVLGEVKSGAAVLRQAARPGDAIYVSGVLGAGELGLQILLSRLHKGPRWKALLQPHYYPQIELELGQQLANERIASAMMDLSDGLSTDLPRLCHASGVGAVIHQTALPTVSIPVQLQALGLEEINLALHGGEDYRLLFTVPSRVASRLRRKLGDARVFRIGQIQAGRGVELELPGGRRVQLAARGWDHFRGTVQREHPRGRRSTQGASVVE